MYSSHQTEAGQDDLRSERRNESENEKIYEDCDVTPPATFSWAST